MTTLKECLEKFDENNWVDCDADDIKSLISSVWSSSREATLKEVKQNMGLMRQWLNEDRITDGQKMVSNEELEAWLLTAERPIK